jgi:large subunit ribosomal protein L16
MLFSPRFFKYKKHQKGTFKNLNNLLTFKHFKFRRVKLVCLSCGRIKSNQINSMFFAINKIMKRLGRITLKMFPYHPISKKPLEIRMGKGKGNVDHWVFNAKPGVVLCEIQTNSLAYALKALKLAQIRLPVKTRILTFFL